MRPARWNRGWTAQFGLIAFDPQTFTRRPKPSAHFLGHVARQNVVKVADVEWRLRGSR